MSFKDAVTNIFTQSDDDEENDDEQEGAVRTEPKNISRYEKGAQTATASLPNISIVEPRKCEDAFGIIKLLNSHCSVCVNFRKMNQSEKQRIIDMLQGGTYALGGTLLMTDDNSILCTPPGITVDASNFQQEAPDEGNA